MSENAGVIGAGPLGAAAAARVEGRGGRRILYLDGWRGISLICVLIGHFVGPLRDLKIGPLGVDLFFVLSGRLMAEILFVERFPLNRFYARRFSRIYPAMLAFVLIIFVVLLKSPLKFKAPFVATSLTFTYNYVAAFGHRTDALDHIWSLCVEDHAYLLLGLLALLSRVRRVPVILIIGALAAASMVDGVVSSLFGQNWFDGYWRTDTHVASVLVSAALYLATRRMAGLASSGVGPWLAPLCAAMGVAFYGAAFSFRLSYTAGTTLLAVAVCTLDVAPAWMRALLANRFLTWVGVLSYSIYLWQQPFYAALPLEPRSLGRTLALLAGAIAAGAASFYLLEQPARQFLNRVLSGGRARIPEPAINRAG
jgi:peptidoglycan/LPS O-acetylase OafA/YrhL